MAIVMTLLCTEQSMPSLARLSCFREVRTSQHAAPVDRKHENRFITSFLPLQPAREGAVGVRLLHGHAQAAHHRL